MNVYKGWDVKAELRRTRETQNKNGIVAIRANLVVFPSMRHS